MPHPPSNDQSAKARLTQVGLIGVLLLAAVVSGESGGLAADAASSNAPKSFLGIIDEQTEKTVEAVAKYLGDNPNADDAELAYRWLFQMARTQGLEDQAIAPAEAYLKRPDASTAATPLAQHVRSVGLARGGKLKEAFAVYEEHLKTPRIRTPNDSIDFAQSLSVQAQLAGDYSAARDVLDRLSSAMFLNPAVRELCDNRLAKLELTDKPAPEISVDDLDGRKFEPAEFKGKVVLVDFWGSDCLPCLAEFPSLKQLYAEMHPRGFEVVGITLDESRETVDQFQKQAKLPWRLAMSQSDHDATRRRFEAAKIPSTYLIDRTGKLVYFDVHGRDLRAAVERLIDPNKKTSGGALP